MKFADTVLMHGKIATVDSDFSFEEAVAVKRNRIMAVGSDHVIEDLIGPGTHVIDLEGKLLLPAAHDSHMHGTSFTMSNKCVNCGVPAIHGLDELKAALASEASRLPEGAWIRGANLDAQSFASLGEYGLTRWHIDEACGEHPAIIMDLSGHGALANSKALELSGLDRNTPDPAGGFLGRRADGELTGKLTEASATQLVFRNTPVWTDEELIQGILETQEMLLSEGYAGFTESTIGPANDNREYGAVGSRIIPLYKKLAQEGRLAVRVALGYYTGDDGAQSAHAMERDLALRPDFDGIDPLWLKMDMVKIFCDGVPTLHSAWMLEDYADTPGYRGCSCLGGEGADESKQLDELYRMVEIAHTKGMQVGIHAIGDRAVEESMNAIIAARKKYPEMDCRHYIIHGEYHSRPYQAKRAAEEKIAFSVQPEVAAYVFESAQSSVGDRAAVCCDIKTALDEGVMLCAGSDAIAGVFENWRMATQTAVTRKSFFTGKVYSPELCVSVEDAVRMFTINAAWQEGQENERGSIEVGKLADFQVLDKDIFEIPLDEISSAQVLMTFVDGLLAYERK